MSSYAYHILNLGVDLVACLHATGVPRQHMISAKDSADLCNWLTFSLMNSVTLTGTL